MQNSQYFKMAIGLFAGSMLYTLLLGDFYPVIKSLFADNDSGVLFKESLAEVKWLNIILKSVFLAGFVTFFMFYLDKRKAKNG